MDAHRLTPREPASTRLLPSSARWTLAVLLAGAAGLAGAGDAASNLERHGQGACLLRPRAGDDAMPAASRATPAMRARAARTNQWYSPVLFSDAPGPLYAQSVSVKPTPAGLEFGLPRKEAVESFRHDIEIRYAHRADVVVSTTAFAPWPARLADAGDWHATVDLGGEAGSMSVTVAHGSPYAFFRASAGDVKLALATPAERVDAEADPRRLVLDVGGTRYAAFGPAGIRWERVAPAQWIGHLPEGSRWWSLAALPDAGAGSLALVSRHAYAFIEGTRADWQVDAARSEVDTTFTLRTRTMEGPEQGALVALYPHQWFGNASVASSLGPAYDTVRGPLKLLEAGSFHVRHPAPGFVPAWPGVHGSPRDGDLADVLKTDRRDARRMMLREGQGAYWQGKGLQRTTELMNVFEAQGDTAARDEMLALVEQRMAQWFGAQAGRGYFACDHALGAVASYPDEFSTVSQINDHHFTYGYWIRAAAEVALRDPDWASPSRWGGMVDLLVDDIATTDRDSSRFPFLRNFDVYEGHSWASGIGIGELGNNQESSSEAINAWAALVLWGEVTGRPALRDLGRYLLATESQAIAHYWFDRHRLTFPKEYRNVEVAQVFGAALLHNTWWTDEPRQIKGINLLPMTTASTHLAAAPADIVRNLDALPAETALYERVGHRPANAPPKDVWQDVFAQYLALADPAAGLARWDRWGPVELGESRTHALHGLLWLVQAGPPDLGVSADTALHQVFRRGDGRRTHLAFNAGATPIDVRFSDGHVLHVPPRSLAQDP